MRRITGASLNGSRPAQISTSAWRGENAWRSMPKRAKSNRLAAVAMNSMAQQAVPNGIGHSELAREEFTAQFTRSWNLATRELGLWPLTSLVVATCFIWSIPLERAPLPYVNVSHEQDQDEDEHLDEEKAGGRGATPHEDDGPRDQKHGFDVEENEQHCDEVELDGEALVGAAEGRHAAFVGPLLDVGRAPRPEEMRSHDQRRRRDDGETEQHEERDIGLHDAREKIH